MDSDEGKLSDGEVVTVAGVFLVGHDGEGGEVNGMSDGLGIGSSARTTVD